MSTCPLSISTAPHRELVLLDGRDVTQEIRGPEVTAAVSRIAADPAIRSHAVSIQRSIIAGAISGIVVEGRDITTVVAPDADVRIFLTADLRAREARRAAEFDDAKTADIMRETVAARDLIDASREHSPLRLAPGVVTIDATHMSLPEVVDAVRKLILERTGGTHDH